MFEIISSFGYLGIFATIIVEIGLMVFPLPGDTLLFSLGILAGTGKFSYPLLILTTFTASVIAGHLGYHIGTLVDEEKLLNNKFYKIKDDHLNKTKKFFDKYGIWAIMFSRYVPVVRSFISQLLGMIEYDKKKFFIYNLIASALWSFTVITSGMIIGEKMPWAIQYLEYAVGFLFILFILVVGKELFFQAKHRK